MKFFIISDTHFNHAKIATYCDRPENFTEIVLKRWNERVTPKDTVIHLGDVAIGPREHIEGQIRSLNGRKILVRGNHDLHGSLSWWCDRGFDFACDAMTFRNVLLTHHPSDVKFGCELNVHGHLHNVWDGFRKERIVATNKLNFPWQRLFALEYTNYCPIEFNEFISHPDRYQSRGPRKKEEECNTTNQT